MLKNIDDRALAMVSLLSASTGVLDVVSIPNDSGTNWLLPKNNVIDIFEHSEHNIMLPWRNIELPIVSLVDKQNTPEHIVVCEGASDIHRVGLLIRGELIQHSIRISDIPDEQDVVDIPYSFVQVRFNDAPHVIPDMDKLAKDLVELD